jgi:hypothetical protein
MTVELAAIESPALLRTSELPYVTEAATGLSFADDTPFEVWGFLIERLVRQSKRIEWAIGDAIRFGEQAYGDDRYTQWIEETGLSENTLTTYRWVAERIDPLRRRKDVGWAHHREVASLPAPVQETLLDRAESAGMTRWALRQAAKIEREKIEGKAVAATGEPIDEPELAWNPTTVDLTDEARSALLAQAPQGRFRTAWISGAIWALVWNGAEDAFTEWKGP